MISVIIPVYNRIVELKRAITSVISQSYGDFEIIVVDDASEINLIDGLRSFHDERLHYIRNDIKSNANVCRNIGVENAKGDYICFLDSDDEFLKNHFEIRLNHMRKIESDACYGSAYYCIGSQKQLLMARDLFPEENILTYLFSGGTATTPSLFLTKISAKSIKWDESLIRHQDYDFTLRLSMKYKITSVAEPTIVIHASESKDAFLKKDHFDSCIKFYLASRHNATNKAKSNYLIAMLEKTSLYRPGKSYEVFYTNELKKYLHHVTPKKFAHTLASVNQKSPAYYWMYYYITLLKRKLWLDAK